ncbi:hypothetical protein [Nonomuraea typhae]|nr:hypothetical protein [Nonomuraea typhae]
MSEVLAEQPDPTPATAVVKGRITVADEVVEKVAALEVPGVADMACGSPG